MLWLTLGGALAINLVVYVPITKFKYNLIKLKHFGKNRTNKRYVHICQVYRLKILLSEEINNQDKNRDFGCDLYTFRIKYMCRIETHALIVEKLNINQE